MFDYNLCKKMFDYNLCKKTNTKTKITNLNDYTSKEWLGANKILKMKSPNNLNFKGNA